MAIYHILHRTQYRYDYGASLSYNEAKLLPRSWKTARQQQTVLSAELIIEPNCQDRRERWDFFGNRVLHFSLLSAHHEMRVVARSDVQVACSLALPTEEQDRPWEWVRDQLWQNGGQDSIAVQQFALTSPFVPLSAELARYAEPSFPHNRPIVTAVNDLMQRIYHDFIFDPFATTIATPLQTVLAHRRGVCQDFAHLMIGCLRTRGLAARYMSGYIETVPPAGQQRLQGADASHAWLAVYIPDYGWLDFDPTNDQIPTEQHIVVAWGRDYSDVTPLKGVFDGEGSHTLLVEVDVIRTDTTPPDVAPH